LTELLTTTTGRSLNPGKWAGDSGSAGIYFRLWHTFIKIWKGTRKTWIVTRAGKGRNFALGLGRIGYSDMSW